MQYDWRTNLLVLPIGYRRNGIEAKQIPDQNGDAARNWDVESIPNDDSYIKKNYTSYRKWKNKRPPKTADWTGWIVNKNYGFLLIFSAKRKTLRWSYEMAIKTMTEYCKGNATKRSHKQTNRNNSVWRAALRWALAEIRWGGGCGRQGNATRRRHRSIKRQPTFEMVIP